MMRVGAFAIRYWRPSAIFFAGVISAVFFKSGTYKEVTQELIALFGLLMAAVLPTMVLTVSVLRPGSLSVQRLMSYSNALANQTKIWIGLFLIALAASISVLIGKITGWSIPVDVTIPKIGLVSFDAIRLINAFITSSLMLLVLRSVAIGNGVLSLLKLSTEVAISEARTRDEQRNAIRDAAISEIKTPDNFGGAVDLKAP